MRVFHVGADSRVDPAFETQTLAVWSLPGEPRRTRKHANVCFQVQQVFHPFDVQMRRFLCEIKQQFPPFALICRIQERRGGGGGASAEIYEKSNAQMNSVTV